MNQNNDQQNSQQHIFLNQQNSTALPQIQPIIYFQNQAPMIDGSQQMINGQMHQSPPVMIPHYHTLVAPTYSQSQNILYNQVIPRFRNHTQQHFINQSQNQMHLSMNLNHQFIDSSNQYCLNSPSVSQIQNQIGSNDPSPINSIVNKDAQQCFSNLIGPQNRSKQGLISSAESFKSSPQPTKKNGSGKLKMQESQGYEFKSDKSDPIKSLRSLRGLNKEIIDQNALNSEFMRSDHKPPSQSQVEVEEEQKQPMPQTNVIHSSNQIRSSFSESGHQLNKHDSKQSAGTPFFQYPSSNENQSQIINGSNLPINQNMNFENAIHQRQVIMNQQNINQFGLVLNNQIQGQIIQENPSRGSVSPSSLINNSPKQPGSESSDYCQDTGEDAGVSEIRYQQRYLENEMLSNLSKDRKGCLIGGYNNFEADDPDHKKYIEDYNRHLLQDRIGRQMVHNNHQEEMRKRAEEQKERILNEKRIMSQIHSAQKEIDQVDVKKLTFHDDVRRVQQEVLMAQQLDSGASQRQERNNSVPMVQLGSALVNNAISINQIYDQQDSQNQINSSIHNAQARVRQSSSNIIQCSSSLE